MATPERYQQIKQVFHAALDHGPDDRVAFVRERCGGDAALAAEVLELLSAHVDADTEFLVAGQADKPPLSTRLGADRGYRVVREIARGGMGVVYLAERADGEYTRQVALKLLTPAAGLREDAIGRLKLERQILARLDHPNIARLLDGGSTDGVPYLVMEYVDGERLDAWAAARPLDVDARLELFLAICAAVAYAHVNLVVHRDLKPGNILVTPEGAPKLLDFGIAKLIADEDGHALTREGERLLTPRYASPEQVRGDPVTTLTDVYSLGVVLYELLTGASPYGELAAAPLRLPQAILSTEPTLPSGSVTAEGTAPAQRELHARRLRGDLDAIVLKALRKVPAERYASVEALAADIRAHRAGLPVAARRGSRAYRARKFVQRHWLALSTAAGVAALTIAFVVGLAHQLAVAAAERDKARAVTAFMVELLGGANTTGENTRDSARTAKLTLRQVLDESAPRIERELDAQPEVQAPLLAALGRVYTGLEVNDAAQRYFETALARYAALGTDPGPEATEARLFLGQIQVARGRLEPALATAERAYADARAAARGDDFDVARALRLRGGVERWLGQLDAAQRDLEGARDMLRRLFGVEHPFYAGALKDLAALAQRRGDYARCATLMTEVLERWEKHFGARHAGLAVAAQQLGSCLNDLGRFDEAEAAYQRALAMHRESIGARTVSMATVLNDFGLLKNQRGNYAEAEALLTEALSINRELYAPDNPQIATALTNLSMAVGQQGRVAEAITLLEEALAISAKGRDRNLHAINLNNLGYKLRQAGRDADAEQRFRQALAIYAADDPQHPNKATVLSNLGRLLAETQRAADGEALLREALALRIAKLPADHYLIAESRSVLGQCLATLGRRDEARPLLEQGYRDLDAKLGPTHERTVKAAKRLEALK